METVLITGINGLVGKHLSKRLTTIGYRVVSINRALFTNESFTYNPHIRSIALETLGQADHIIHLAGENIGNKRWTPEQKQKILTSRVHTAELLLKGLNELSHRPKTFISASAIGYYGYGEEMFTEEFPAGEGFLPEVCKQWEASANAFEALGIRTVKIRTGLVLSREGGVLPQFIRPMNIGFGLPFGNGEQAISWIHIDDLSEIYIRAITSDDWIGSINAVAPETLSNRTFVKALSLQMRKPMLNIAVPDFVLNWIMGERSELVLKGTRVSPSKLQSLHFPFKYSEIGSALESLIAN